MTDNRQMRTPTESIMSREDQQNAGGERRVVRDTGFVYYDQAPLSDYPRMMYRATETEQTQEYADVVGGLKDPPMVVNCFDGLLCDTIVAHDVSEAEVLATNGWDLTPKAAHGVEDGLAKATSAKDDEIAALRAQLAAMNDANGAEPEPVKRGPGRPPKGE